MTLSSRRGTSESSMCFHTTTASIFLVFMLVDPAREDAGGGRRWRPRAKGAALKVGATAGYADGCASRGGRKTKKARSADALLPAFSIAKSDKLSRTKYGQAAKDA